MADTHKIDQYSETLENLPPEELQKRIEEDKKQLKESSVLAVTALIAIIVLCMAWFVSNNQVKMTSGNIAAMDKVNFELASSGNAEVIDTRKNPLSNFIEKIGGMIGEAFNLNSTATGTVTSASNPSIKWNMSQGHQNFANVVGSGQIDDTGDENIGLQPGAYGELTFCIIPKIDGAQTVNCTLSLTPYVDSAKRSGLATTDDNQISFSQGNTISKEVYEITDDRVKKILSGHIYFFRKKENGDNGLYSSWLEPDEDGLLHFTVDLTDDTKKDVSYPVTIYWNWPMLISQVLLQAKDEYLGGRNQLFNKETQDKIVTFMCSENPDHSAFFFISDNYSKLDVDKNLISGIHNSSWNSSSSINKDSYSDINKLYNNADQYLGKTVSYVSLELSATN